MNPLEFDILRVLPELKEMFNSWKNVVFFDEDPIDPYKRKLLRHGLFRQNFIVFTRIGDRHDYYELVPYLEKEQEYYFEHGKLKNYLVVISPHPVDADLLREYSYHLTCIQMPSMYAWYTDKMGDMRPPQPAMPQNISKHFLSFNNRATWYRQALFYAFHKFNLLPKSYFSYLGTSRVEYTKFNAELETRVTEWYNQGIDIPSLRELIPYRMDGDSEVPDNIDGWNGDWGCYDTDLYDKSFCSVITESNECGEFNFADRFVDHTEFFTEKTFKAIAMQHPFLIFGNQHNLKYLRDLGFETFGDVFDESYDSVRSHRDRFSVMMQEILRIGNFSIDDCVKLREKLRPILDHNYYHFYDTLPTLYQNDLERVRAQLTSLWKSKTAMF